MDARAQSEISDLVAEVEEILDYLRDSYGGEAIAEFVAKLSSRIPEMKEEGE